MLEHDSLRKVLQQQAINAAASISLKCKIGEEAFNPPTDGTPYAEFWWKTGTSEQMELGPRTGYECAPGLLQFTIFAPEKSGDGPALKVAGPLKHWFDRQQWLVDPDGYVNLEAASVKPINGLRNGHHVVIVDAAFDFYYRNPNA